MSNLDRRQLLKQILGNLVQAAGTVVLASAVESPVKAQDNQPEGGDLPQEDVQQRADRLAASGNFPANGNEAEANEFLNVGFRNSPGGAFRNRPSGAFRNAPFGAFRNSPVGGFRNTPLGAFGNGGWPNGGWGGFRNGGWPNYGWRNWW